mgnify:FL=1
MQVAAFSRCNFNPLHRKGENFTRSKVKLNIKENLSTSLYPSTSSEFLTLYLFKGFILNSRWMLKSNDVAYIASNYLVLSLYLEFRVLIPTSRQYLTPGCL